MLDAKTLKLAREAAEATMTSTLKRVAVTKTDDGHGGWTETATEGTATICRMQPRTGLSDAVERIMGSRVESRNRYRVFAPWTFQALEGDRLEVDGSTYEIEAARSSSSSDLIESVWDVAMIRSTVPAGGAE